VKLINFQTRVKGRNSDREGAGEDGDCGEVPKIQNDNHEV